MSDQANNEATEASSLLVMARQLHEQHVSAAREEAAQIVAVARAEADRLVSDATAEAHGLVTDARNEHDGLQASIERLREFEGAYRASLSDYLQGLLSEVAPQDAQDEPTSVDEAPSQSNAFLASAPVFATAPAFSEEPLIAPAAEADEESVKEEQPEIVPEPSEEASAFSADDGDGFTADDFDTFAEPQAGEDVVLDFPEADEAEAPMDETPLEDERGQLPDFDQAPEAAEDDTVEALLASEAELKAETDAVPTVDVEQHTQEDNSSEKLRELLDDLDGAEVDDDGGSSTEADTLSEEQPKFPSFAAEDEPVSAEDLNATDVDAPEGDNKDAENSEDEHKDDEAPEKKGPFSFFTQK